MYNVLKQFSESDNFVFLNGKDQHELGAYEQLFASCEASSPQQALSGQNKPIPDLASREWHFGFIAYEYKNQLEDLKSEKRDCFGVPDYFFFKPSFVMTGNGSTQRMLLGENPSSDVLSSINREAEKTWPEIRLHSRLSKAEYITSVLKIKEKIQAGDIYEMNFCQEFYAEEIEIDPLTVYKRLIKLSPAPFSAFCKFGDLYVISSSPERFLKKSKNKLISQPIKGTQRRSSDPEEDQLLKRQLQNDEKERSENIMIVDLVRNDLSRIAEKGTVKVDELCGIYSFGQVHQMISTISAELGDGVSLEEILKATFPMGSMTGAPKIKAMKLIEEFENTRRGIYSGALGYLTPEGDFDFSVVIRSILYDSANKYVSIGVGGAITAKSDPEKEYEECLLKARAMVQALNGRID